MSSVPQLQPQQQQALQEQAQQETYLKKYAVEEESSASGMLKQSKHIENTRANTGVCGRARRQDNKKSQKTRSSLYRQIKEGCLQETE